MTRAVCTGWTRTGSAPASGATTNTGSFTLQTASTVTWHWVITELALSNQVVSSAASHAARDSLRALDNYIIEPAGVVDFSVGSTGTAILGPGFQAQPGSTLTVRPGAAF
jgi:hypothetical protein